MLENPKRYTITAALPYTNGPIHIGHLAGVYVPSDIYARYLRLQGKDVAFMCGKIRRFFQQDKSWRTSKPYGKIEPL